MMDFGFAGFLDKFESRFGSKVTTILLTLIGLAIAVFCVNILYTMAIQPLLSALSEMVANKSVNITNLWDFIKNVAVLGVVVVLAANIRNAIDIRNKRRTVDSILGAAEIQQQKSEKQITQLDSVINTEEKVVLYISQFIEVVKEISETTKSPKLKTEIKKLFSQLDQLPRLKDVFPSLQLQSSPETERPQKTPRG